MGVARTRHANHIGLRFFVKLLLLLAMVSLTACSLEDPSDESGVVGTGIIFEGTVSREKQLAANEVEIRAQTGERATAIINSDGQYFVEEVPGVGPWLIRSSLGNDNYRYGIAYPATIAHVHSYTDVALRSWFLARYDSDIDTAFESVDTLPVLPSADQFTALAGQFIHLVEFVLQDYGLSGTQLLSERFRTDGTGIDLFLDQNPVLVDEDGGRQITIVITDPDNNTQTSTSADILIGEVERQSDIEPPSMPSNLRALSGASGETVLVWDPSTDNTAVIGYDVLRNGESIAISPYPVYTDTGASAGTSNLYEVKSIDIAGNRSEAAAVSTDNVVFVGDLPAPANVVAVVSTTQRVVLNWTQGRIEGVAGFNIYRGATASSLSSPSSRPLVSVTSTSVTDATISARQEYWYSVTAVDALGKESPQSVPLRVLTTGIALTPPDTPQTVVPPFAGLTVPDTEAMSCETVFPAYNINFELKPDPGCYKVEGDIVVNNFGVLKLQPGVVLKFAAGSKLLIERRGRLMSEGTNDNPVVLTGQQTVEGWWWGVQFNRSDDSQNIISRTVIEYHGLESDTESAGISLVSSTNAPSQLRVENSLIRYGGSYGIDIPGLDAELKSFRGNLVTENVRAASTNYTSLSSFDDGSSFTDNDTNRLFVAGASYDEDVSIDDIGIPLQIGGFISQESGTITISAGVEMFFIEDQVFIVRENLKIEGTADNPVVLTSITETPGTWQGLQLIEGANAELSYVIIENGGVIGGRNPEGSNLFANDARMSLDNVTLRSSSSYGYHATGNQVIIDKAENINIDDNAYPDVVGLSVR